MTGVSCFPLSIQTQQTSSDSFYGNRYGSVELELVGDLLSGMAGVAGRLAHAFETTLKAKATADANKPQKSEASSRVNQATKRLSEVQKLALARDPNAAPAMLVSLSQDVSSAVRNEVALNPSSPAFILRKLALDSDKFIASQARTRLS